ncbi:MAG: L-threonylcarbamoyladenylate synthase [Candidatus Delongbacteria bacterium]|jgi:L-threonylcarbamoyladenylate synthase|nr:L-threonylcarbamoyladenylate synthase [Candidatus Delongbacteria bacterium]
MKSQSKIDELIKTIKNDGLVIIPTDTIYGFSCLPTSKIAIDRITNLKQRVSKPFIVLDTDEDRMRDYFKYAFADKIFKEVINQKVWPGKLTIIADKCGKIDYPFLSGISTIAIRYPDSGFIDSICSGLKSGIVSTSINLSGQKELSSISEIKDMWQDKVDYVWEAETESNNSSLIINIDSWKKSIEIVRDPETVESKEILLKLDKIVKKCQ